MPRAAPLVARANVTPVPAWWFTNATFPDRTGIYEYNATANASGGTPPYRYAWDFGDGSSPPIGAAVAHRYDVAGDYLIRLTVTDSVGAVGTSTAWARPRGTNGTRSVVAQATPVLGSVPLNVTFRVTSSSAWPASYAWSFGDGRTNASARPKHTYDVPGVYAARLNVTSPDGTNASFGLTVIAVGAGPLTVLATSTLSQDCHAALGLNVTYGSVIAGGVPPLTFSWIFGDGSAPSSLPTPSHDYGWDFRVYEVNLTLTDGTGAVATSTVGVAWFPLSCPPPIPPPLAVRIADTVVGYCDRAVWNNVTFLANVSGGTPPYAYTWDFGDGSPISSLPAPSHSYASPGRYTVNVTVVAANGSTGRSSVTLIVALPPCAPPAVIAWVGILVTALAAGAIAAGLYLATRKPRRPL